MKYIEGGATNKEAALLAGITEETFYQWKRTKPEFSESLKKAEVKRKIRLTALIIDAAKKTWQAAAWYLERVYHDEFAKKEIREHEGKVSAIAKLVERFKKEKDESTGSRKETEEGD